MTEYFEIVDPSRLSWQPTPLGVPGCEGKKLWRFSEDGLGSHGRSGPYTTLYRFGSGAAYLPFRVSEGCCEVWVLRGALEVNGREIPEGHWLRLGSGLDQVGMSSSEGCKILAVVRGYLELV